MTDDLLATHTKATLVMEDVIAWEDLKVVRNGFASGDVSKLKAGSGLKSWLGFLRVFVEVIEEEEEKIIITTLYYNINFLSKWTIQMLPAVVGSSRAEQS